MRPLPLPLRDLADECVPDYTYVLRRWASAEETGDLPCQSQVVVIRSDRPLSESALRDRLACLCAHPETYEFVDVDRNTDMVLDTWESGIESCGDGGPVHLVRNWWDFQQAVSRSTEEDV